MQRHFTKASVLFHAGMFSLACFIVLIFGTINFYDTAPPCSEYIPHLQQCLPFTCKQAVTYYEQEKQRKYRTFIIRKIHGMSDSDTTACKVTMTNNSIRHDVYVCEYTHEVIMSVLKRDSRLTNNTGIQVYSEKELELTGDEMKVCSSL